MEAELVYVPIENYAVQQNRIPVIKKLVLQNLSEEDFSGIVLRIRSIQEFAKPWEQPLEFLSRHERLEIDIIPLLLSAEYLSGLTERLAGDILVEVLKDDVVLISKRYTIDVLAFD